jgi:hypothetical protein
MTSDELTSALADLRESFPEIGETTVYYIGNIWHGPYLDDRSWAVSLDDWKVYGDRNHSAPHNLPIGSTEDLERLTPMQLAYKLGKRVGIAAKAYQDKYGRRSPFVGTAP